MAMQAERLHWPALRARPAPERDPGTCHAVGEAAQAVASALAQATGRRFAADGAAAVLGPTDMLVALADNLSDRHLDAVEATVGASIPGIIVGRDPTELRAKAAASLAALAAPPEGPPLRLDIAPQLPIGLIDGEGFALAGRHADAAALRTLLERGESLVSLTGHGDGIDGDLGQLVLCPVDRPFLAAPAARAPTCRISGHCHRCDAGLSSQRLASRQLHPSAIRARAMIWNTCVGWPSRRSFVDRTFGAGLRLAESPSIGALVTTSRISLASPVTIDGLTAALLRGVPIGEAVASHNAGPAARRAGHRLLLFGDPLLRVAPDLAGEAAPPPPRCRAGPARRTPPRAFVQAPAASPADRRLFTAMAALRSEDVAEKRAGFAEIGASLARGGLEGAWVREGTRLGTRSARCPHCRAPAVRHDLQLGPKETRHLLICRRCEVAADLPERPLIAVRFGARGVCRVTVRGPAADLFWLGAIVARRCLPYATVTTLWPQAPDGAPARSFDLDETVAPAPTTLSAAFLVGGGLHVFSRPYACGALARKSAPVSG